MREAPLCSRIVLALLAASALAAGGCGVGRETLMVTPVVYHAEDGLDPFAHLDDAHRSVSLPIFYATNRRAARDAGPGRPQDRYDNRRTETLQLGAATVTFDDRYSWEQLHDASRVDPRDEQIVLELTDVREMASVPARLEAPQPPAALSGSADAFFEAINAQLALATDPELLIYVHGAKVNFYNACVFAAELDHFTGRDMVAIAYAWPTHQDILPYLFGEDVDRAYESAHQFAALLRMLAERTTAERINIICWSAGGRVVSLALDELDRYERSHGFDPASLRLGAAIFAAPDVPAHRFLERLPGIHDVVERIIITASDNDVALEKAAEFMGGDMRMGLIDDSLDPDALADLDRFDHIELVDVSYDKDQRGFDIDGHRYWFRHPWVASDVVLVTRTRLPADQRGLERSHIDRVWFLPADYPDRVRTAAREALGDSWAAEGRAPRGD